MPEQKRYVTLEWPYVKTHQLVLIGLIRLRIVYKNMHDARHARIHCVFFRQQHTMANFRSTWLSLFL